MKRLILALACAVTLGGCASVFRDRIYRPSEIAAEPAWERAPETVRVTAGDGQALTGLYWAPTGTHRDVVVYYHGNGGHIWRDGVFAQALAEGGRGVLLASYRGYSGNGGRPTEAGLRADAAAFADYARTRLPAGGRLFLYGHSLGGAMALGEAARTPVAAVATLGTFARITEFAPAVVRFAMPDRYDNLATIARVAAPVTLLHGTADEVVAFEDAARLSAASGGRARVVPLPGQGHMPDMRTTPPHIWQALEGAAPAP